MARKGIDRAGLLGRTDKYYATDISGLFNALLLINNALIESDAALTEANLSADGICPIGYSSLESDITDSENKLATLMTVPDQIVKGLIDTVDAEYESELSSGACSNIQNIRIDNITMRGDKYNPILPTEKIELFRKKITKREEALGVTEEVLRARWGDLIPENIRERADAFPCPYRKYELWIAYDACKTEADVRFLTGLLSKDYITTFNTDPGTLTEGISKVLGTFARTLLPADMHREEIDTSELEKFNNALMSLDNKKICSTKGLSLNEITIKENYLSLLADSCGDMRNKSFNTLLNNPSIKDAGTTESDYYAHNLLGHLFGKELIKENMRKMEKRYVQESDRKNQMFQWDYLRNNADSLKYNIKYFAEVFFDGAVNGIDIQDLYDKRAKLLDWNERNLYENLHKSVSGYMNDLQAMVTINSTLDAINTVIKYDDQIKAAAKEFNVEVEMIQAVIFQEVRFYNVGDYIADDLVRQSRIYDKLLDDFFSGKRVQEPIPPIIYKKDSSTGIGQIFAKTVTEDADVFGDEEQSEILGLTRDEIWDKLQDDEFNIRMVAATLRQKSGEGKSIEEILRLYNGSGYFAEKYGRVTKEYYDSFKQYNMNCCGDQP